MPCRNSRTGTTDYDESLDILREIISKYRDTHAILLLGDFNASLTRNPENQQDRKLREFLKENDMHIQANLHSQDTPTFFHHNGKDNAQIDYIFHIQSYFNLNITNIEPTKIHPMHPLNTSDHTTISSKILLNENMSTTATPQQNKMNTETEKTFQKPRWAKCDSAVYNATVQKKVQETSIDFETKSDSILGLEIRKLETIMLSATTRSIEGHKPLATSKKTKGRGKWNKDIAQASQDSKAIHREIKKSGAASKEQAQKQKEAKRRLRRLQRQQAYIERETLYKEIMTSEKEDQQLFYKLINKQRKTSQEGTKSLSLEGIELTSDEHIINGWKIHFEKLATPQDTNWDKDHEDLVNMNDILIQQLCTNINEPILPITHEETRTAIKKLKKNKAPDAYGITAEHIQLAEDTLVPLLTTLANRTIESGTLPHHLKEGVLTPVLKKGKDQKIPSNYRGITVTTIFSKILEHALQTRLNNILDTTQSKLQRGFTSKTSPLNAAFLVSEAIAEHLDQNSPVALVTLDAEKAFDRVWHERLFLKLYNDGVQGKLWLLLRDMQANGTTRVKWNCNLSTPFKTLQGIRQGAKLSTTLYKRYNNPLLLQIEDHNLGTNIGDTNVGAPTVADDISMLPQTPVDTQVMLHTVTNNAKLDKVNFNATKSDVVIYNSNNKGNTKWEIGENIIESSSSTTHLGLQREDNNKFNIQPKVQIARRTMYSLLGAGLHGRRGLNPLTSYKIWECFGLPRCTYGLESIKISKKDVDSLEKYQRSLLKQLQSLPDRCANIPVYTLLGAKPMQITLDIKMLSFFTNMIRQKDSIEYRIICRQLAVKSEESASFTVAIRKTLQKYDLPDAFSLVENTPTKEKWKAMVREATNKKYRREILEEKETKNSLRYLAIQELPLDEPHQIYETVGSSPHEVEKAAIKARLLTGCYTLQAHKLKFNQHEIDKFCPLCSKEIEDREHFILKCEMLERQREKHLQRLFTALPNILEHKEKLLQCILDSSHEDLSHIVPKSRSIHKRIEEISRGLLYDLHVHRSRMISKNKH